MRRGLGPRIPHAAVVSPASEALLRWAPPGEALISAGTFIKVAEDAGLSIALGEWVLREACRQMAQWHKEGLSLQTMAVNLSSQQFHHLDIANTIAGALAQSGIEPQALELEIAESSLMAPGADVEATLIALKRLGVKLAIDDFGTGYSSLAYLKRFPVDKLKVDQSFVRDIPDTPRACKSAMSWSSWARRWGWGSGRRRRNGGPARLSARAGCDYMQGHLLGRPMPAAEIAAQLRGNAAALRRLQIIDNASVLRPLRTAMPARVCMLSEK